MAIGATGFSFMGIGLESTRGTAVTPVDFLPCTSLDGEDATDVLQDNGMRASMATAYGAVKGTTTASYSIEGDVFVDTIGYLLAAIFGSRATTGAGPYIHTFSLNNNQSQAGQTPSYTITDYQGLQARRYTQATCSSVGLRLSAQELFTHSAAFTSIATTTTTTPTPSFGTLSPIAGWAGTINLAGSANALLEDLDLTFSRNVTPVHTVSGQSNPVQIWSGPLSVSGRANFLAADETEFTRYLGVTTPALVVTLAQGSASLAVTMSKVVYTSAKVERGDDFTQVSVQFDALANTTDAGASGGFAPAKAVLTNSIAGTTYGG